VRKSRIKRKKELNRYLNPFFSYQFRQKLMKRSKNVILRKTHLKFLFDFSTYKFLVHLRLFCNMATPYNNPSSSSNNSFSISSIAELFWLLLMILTYDNLLCSRATGSVRSYVFKLIVQLILRILKNSFTGLFYTYVEIKIKKKNFSIFFMPAKIKSSLKKNNVLNLWKLFYN